MMGASNIRVDEASPSQQVMAAANAEVVVPTTDGRSVTLKKPGVLAQFKMIEMLGPVVSQNMVFVNMAFPMMYVTAIDSDPVSRLTTRVELDALIQRLDEAGIEAVVMGVQENFGQQNPGADKAAVKN